MQISEKRLLGWEPIEFHDHEYDDAGRLIRTAVSREPEWDDDERAKMQGLALYESELCKCGLHQSIADSDPDMEIVLPVCPVCAGLAQQMRVLDAEDERAAGSDRNPSPPGAQRASDGRRVELKFRNGPTLDPLTE